MPITMMLSKEYTMCTKRKKKQMKHRLFPREVATESLMIKHMYELFVILSSQTH